MPSATHNPWRGMTIGLLFCPPVHQTSVPQPISFVLPIVRECPNIVGDAHLGEQWWNPRENVPGFLCPFRAVNAYESSGVALSWSLVRTTTSTKQSYELLSIYHHQYISLLALSVKGLNALLYRASTLNFSEQIFKNPAIFYSRYSSKT